MNLVETIQDQFDGETVDILSSKIGAGGEQTRTAIHGAVPALLAGLNMVSKQPAGAGALANAVQQVDAGVMDNLNDTLKGGLGSVAQQGSSLLSQVMAGGGVLSGVSRAVSSYSGLSQGSTSSLMGVMGPLVLGNLKRQLGGNSSPADITNLLHDQEANIADALPAELSSKLSDLGGLDVNSMLGAATGVAGLGAAGLGAVGLGERQADSNATLNDTSAVKTFNAPKLDGNDPLEPEPEVASTSQPLPPQTSDAPDIWRIVLMAIIAVLVVWLIINLLP